MENKAEHLNEFVNNNNYLDCKVFFEYLNECGIEFFTGVPDSLLKNFCSYISDNVDNDMHVISTNEGSSVGLAIGYHLATSKVPLVYMQNSGFGNIINPVLSLADSKVYQIPMLLMIGWRGEPGFKDEPQHIKQGEVTIPLIEAMGLEYIILDKDIEKTKILFKKVLEDTINNSRPTVILVRKDTFSNYESTHFKKNKLQMSREIAIEIILENIGKDSIVVSTTGKASREVFENRVSSFDTHERDFLTVGGMGHTSQIALGISMQKKNKKVFCLDGDGSALMHFGALGLIGDLAPDNFVHIILNNGAHDSVGGQPTIGHKINFTDLANQFHYKYSFRCINKSELKDALINSKKIDGPVMIEILINKGSRKNLGRPTIAPIDNKNNFMNFLKK